jgi:hypothetical protein
MLTAAQNPGGSYGSMLQVEALQLSLHFFQGSPIALGLHFNHLLKGSVSKYGHLGRY